MEVNDFEILYLLSSANLVVRSAMVYWPRFLFPPKVVQLYDSGSPASRRAAKRSTMASGMARGRVRTTNDVDHGGHVPK